MNAEASYANSGVEKPAEGVTKVLSCVCYEIGLKVLKMGNLKIKSSQRLSLRRSHRTILVPP